MGSSQKCVTVLGLLEMDGDRIARQKIVTSRLWLREVTEPVLNHHHIGLRLRQLAPVTHRQRNSKDDHSALTDVFFHGQRFTVAQIQQHGHVLILRRRNEPKTPANLDVGRIQSLTVRKFCRRRMFTKRRIDRRTAARTRLGHDPVNRNR